MDITPQLKESAQVITAYGDGGFRVSGEQYKSSLIVFADRLHEISPQAFSEITDEHIGVLLAAQDSLDIVLFGTGAQMQMLPAQIRAQLKEAGIIADVMDTGAACRTYNVLLAEGRRVAALLVSV